MASVDIDGYITNSGSGIEMMFCTKLGVSFPDPENRVCALSNEYSKFNKDVDQSFISRFNQLISDEAVVLPYFYSELNWLYTKDIDTKTIPTSGVGYPIFEQLKSKLDLKVIFNNLKSQTFFELNEPIEAKHQFYYTI